MAMISSLLVFLLLKLQLKLASSQCVDTLSEQFGVIKSPGHPGKYPVSTNCRWKVIVLRGQRIKFTLRHFDIVYTKGCKEDRLEIHGLMEQGHETEVLCGYQESPSASFTSLRYQTDVTFTSDFRLFSSTRTGFMLTYKAIGCASPPPTIKSALLVDKLDYYAEGHNFRYTCPKGKKFKSGLSEQVSVCLKDNTWQHWNDTCVDITCSPPIITTGVTHQPVQQVYRLDSLVSFSCNDQLSLVGSSVLVCTDSGHWNTSTPICQDKAGCPMPLEPQNGDLISAAVEIGGQAVFTCDIGYRLDGAEKIICQSSKKWNPAPPLCAHIICPPQRVTNGSHLIIDRVEVDDQSGNQSEAWYGSRILYSCEPGYQISNGIITRQCDKTGLWDGVEPTCTKVLCTIPDIPEHGYHHVDKLETGSKAVFGCDDGYVIVGPTQLTCQQDGTWSSASPVCTEPEPTWTSESLETTTILDVNTTHDPKTTANYGGDANVDAIVGANSNSTGRDIGIGIGLLILILLIVAVIYFVIQKRRVATKPKTVKSDFENPTYDAFSGTVQLRNENGSMNGVMGPTTEPWSRNPTYRNAESVVNTRPDSALVDNEEPIYGNTIGTFR